MLLHRLLDVHGRVDVLQFDAVHFDPPLIGCFIQNGAQFHIDGVAGSQAFIQLQLTDDVPQGGLRQLLNGIGQVIDFVDRFDRVCDLEVNQRIDFRDHIVLRYDPLLGEIKNRFAQVHAVFQFVLDHFLPIRPFGDDAPCDITGPVDDGDDDVDASMKGSSILAKALNDHGFALANYPNAFDDDDRGE